MSEQINYVNKPIMDENVQITKQKLALKQPKQLETPLTVLGQTETQVEGALDAINNKEQVLTKAEYDALTPEEQNNGTTYYISDINGDYSFADTPIGAILPFGGTNAPDDWLLCQGQEVSRVDYADLYAVIGDAFGSGDGSTTFNVPNLKGKVSVGLDSNDTDFDTLGESGGEKTHTLTVAEIPSHSHTPKNDSSQTMTLIGDGNGSNPIPVYSSSVSYAKTSFTYLANTGGNGAHNNLQPYVVTNYIIKAKITTLPLDFETVVDDKLDEKVDKVTGKGLSTNDFTDTLKTKLDNITNKTPVPDGTDTSLVTTGEKYNWNQTQFCVRLSLSASVIPDAAHAFEYIWRNYPEQTVEYGVSFSIVNSLDWFSGVVYSDKATDTAGKTCWGWVLQRSNSGYNERFYKCFYNYGVGTSAVPLSTTVVQRATWTMNTASLPIQVASLTTPDGAHRDNWSLTIVPRQLQTYWVNYLFNVYRDDTDATKLRIFCVGAFDTAMSRFTTTQTLDVDLIWVHV